MLDFMIYLFTGEKDFLKKEIVTEISPDRFRITKNERNLFALWLEDGSTKMEVQEGDGFETYEEAKEWCNTQFGVYREVVNDVFYRTETADYDVP